MLAKKMLVFLKDKMIKNPTALARLDDKVS